jgi:molybdopterin synthase catalytic subunit
MAVAKMGQIADEVRARWPDIADIAIVQRIGRLEVGDVAVAIAVSSGHRDQGCFEACRYAIDRLKQIVPIWKKEVGPSGEEWVEGDYLPT